MTVAQGGRGRGGGGGGCDECGCGVAFDTSMCGGCGGRVGKDWEARTEEGFGSCRCDRGVIRFQLPICHTFTLSGLDSVTL